MQKKVGKAAEPKNEELEFIYCRIEEGLPDDVIIEELVDYQLIARSGGFIKRRRREYHAAKKVLEEILKKKVDPVLARQRIRHWNELADAARDIRRNIDRVRQSSYELIGSIVSGSIAAPVTFGPKHETRLLGVNSFVAEGVLSHLQAEFEEFHSIANWRLLNKQDIQSTITREMLKQLESRFLVNSKFR